MYEIHGYCPIPLHESFTDHYLIDVLGVISVRNDRVSLGHMYRVTAEGNII